MNFRSVAMTLLLASSFVLPSSAEEIIYDNTEDYLDTYATIANEYGDEITLGGAARTLKEVLFEYYGEFLSQADETARVRIYAQDGPRLSEFYTQPGTLLWESPLFPVRSGFNTQGFGNLNVNLPETVTFAIQFNGLTMNNTEGQRDAAGLLFYALPSVGMTFNDFWLRRNNGWFPATQPGVAKNNFGIRFIAVPEPSVVALGTMAFVLGGWKLLRRKR